MFDYVVFTILIRFIDLKKFEKLKQKLEEFDFVVVVEFVELVVVGGTKVVWFLAGVP